MNIRPRIRWAVAFLVVFVARGVLGSVITTHIIGKAVRKGLQLDTWAEVTERELDRKLRLSPTQLQEVHGIVHDMVGDFRNTFGRTCHDFGVTIVEAGRRIDRILTPEQRTVHAAMKAALRKKLRDDFHMELPPE